MASAMNLFQKMTFRTEVPSTLMPPVILRGTLCLVEFWYIRPCRPSPVDKAGVILTVCTDLGALKSAVLGRDGAEGG